MTNTQNPTMTEPRGYLNLVLHAHLPFVRHPEHEDFLEEDWLYEAVVETYLPLLDVFRRLAFEGVHFRVTMTMSPPLCNMLQDELLQSRIRRRLERLIELGDRELARLENDRELLPVARMYRERFGRFLGLWDECRGDLVAAFGELQDRGHLEIITCGATHGFLPLLRTQPQAVRAQVAVARADYRARFGREPRGIWLPECGYFPGLDGILAEQGIGFFFVDSHGLENATPRPPYGVHAPLLCPTGVAALARDAESSKQVWSAEEGYPGDPFYREFYRDIGFDLPLDYIGPYVQATGERKNTGFKYFRITGRVGRKQAYQPAVAEERAAEHAGQFLVHREKQVEWLAEHTEAPPLVVAPYDAELYGHWWFEGPRFLEYLLRKVHFDSQVLKTTTPWEYLAAYPDHFVGVPSMSSWGAYGYCEVWCEGSNDWIYRHLHAAAERMTRVATERRAASGDEQRALNQAARELLLAQSSDWAFIIKTGTMVEYAVRRTREHLLRLASLLDMVEARHIDRQVLGEIEARDNVFAGIDFRVYAE